MSITFYIGLSLLLISSSSFDQETYLPRVSNPAPVEIRLAESPSWQGNCLKVSLKLISRSKDPIFLLNQPFEGIEAYVSVMDSTNSLKRGVGEIWVQVYGWTDVFYPGSGSPIRGSMTNRTVCVEGTFPVRVTGKDALRDVPLQGRLRLYVSYGLRPPSRGANKLKHSVGSTLGTSMIEFPIPCRNLGNKDDCHSPAPVFPGEHLFFDPPEPVAPDIS